MASTNRPPANIAKIAVKFYVEDPLKTGQMVDFDQTRPLAACIADICNSWLLDKPENWALQSDPDKTHSSSVFITEKNRGEIQNGSYLTLSPSPAKTVKDILEGISMGDATKKQAALVQLSNHAPDVTFAQEFMNQQGIDLLLTVIASDGWDKSPATASFGEATATTLASFLNLMEHGIVLWDRFDQNFIAKIASYVNKSSCDAAVVQSSLTILENLLLCSQKRDMVGKQISCSHLIEHLKTKNEEVQQNVLSLINAIFSTAPLDATRKNLADAILSPATRDIFLKDVIPIGQTVKSEIARQLYILQCNLMKTVYPVILTDSDIEKQISELKKATTSVLAEVPSATIISRKNTELPEELQRLGFKNCKNPAEELTAISNGVLVLYCMHYFASSHAEQFRQWMLESFSRDPSDCSFFRGSVEVVRVLLETFHIDQSSSDEHTGFDRVVFSSDNPFREAFVIAMETLNKTWKEMRASNQDFAKVMDVLTEQLNLSLRDPPLPESLDKWRARIREYSYLHVVKIRSEHKKAKEELESRAEPIVRLREKLTPEILDLIAENRLRHMRRGSRVVHRESGVGFRFGEKKYSWYCALSGNNKRLHYGNCEENVVPNIQNLRKEIAISEVRGLLLGKDCPHVKNKKSSSVAFSLVLEGEKKTLDFIASTEHEFNIWTDGLHKLLGEPMTSPLASQELEKLLTWEIKMKLLGTEGVAIPEKSIEVPPLPTNFNYRK